ncbi:formylmethanofuran dehydrogenase subunit D [Methanohalophilus levihalophilus]|uniref:molybdopterin dinucleotide binding domain-containing protein n=1 Tax=Methanohalophilus levihalophilus TaxID=1431282 RepID=UPI001AEB351F|nr:molybdopterin dinucleotide binding domain-containing protein [Methanohalophilus levihalophilus]MBP2029703.1 formylmethanofuran dehydrogenase subunit D [Methanohalophilus levihalophilus]
MKFLLNTGSTIDEGRLAKGGNKYSQDYMDECAVCWISPEDFNMLGCPEKVKVTSTDGKHSIVVNTKCTDSVVCGDVFMPRAIWSNVVVDPWTFSTGSPLYKGSPVTVEPSDEEVLSAEDVVQKLYYGGE